MARAERERTGKAIGNAGSERRRRIPSVDALLRSNLAGARAAPSAGRWSSTRCRSRSIRSGRPPNAAPSPRRRRDPRAGTRADVGDRRGPRPRDQRDGCRAAHGSGRAPLPAQAAAAAARAGQGYVDLEVDRGTGARERRSTRAERLLTSMTGAEDGLVVNNGAAALLLALASLARGKGVLVSRGELIEIGGEFRSPTSWRPRGAARRGGYDEPDARVGLPLCAVGQDGADPQGASQQLPRRGVRLDAERQGPGRDRAAGERPLPVRPRLGTARTGAGCRGERAERDGRARGRRRPHRVLGRQAPRRPAGRDRARTERADRASAAPPDRAGRAYRQDAGSRARVGPGSARPRPGLRPARVDDAPRTAHARPAPRRRAGDGARRRARRRARDRLRVGGGRRRAAGDRHPVVRRRDPCSPTQRDGGPAARVRRRCSAGSPNAACCSTSAVSPDAIPDLVRAVRYALEGDDLPDD